MVDDDVVVGADVERQPTLPHGRNGPTGAGLPGGTEGRLLHHQR